MKFNRKAINFILIVSFTIFNSCFTSKNNQIVLEKKFQGDPQFYFVFTPQNTGVCTFEFGHDGGAFRSNKLLELPKGTTIDFKLENNDVIRILSDANPAVPVQPHRANGASESPKSLSNSTYFFKSIISINTTEAKKLFAAPLDEVIVSDMAFQSGLVDSSDLKNHVYIFKLSSKQKQRFSEQKFF